MLKRRYSFLSAPSGPKTTHEATVPSPPVWLMSKHSSRAGGSGRSSSRVSSASISSTPARCACRIRSACSAFSRVSSTHFAARRMAYLDRVTGLRAERLGERYGIGQGPPEQNFRGRLRAGVVLHDEGREGLVGLGQRGSREITTGARGGPPP